MSLNVPSRKFESSEELIERDKKTITIRYNYFMFSFLRKRAINDVWLLSALPKRCHVTGQGVPHQSRSIDFVLI